MNITWSMIHGNNRTLRPWRGELTIKCDREKSVVMDNCEFPKTICLNEIILPFVTNKNRMFFRIKHFWDFGISCASENDARSPSFQLLGLES